MCTYYVQVRLAVLASRSLSISNTANLRLPGSLKHENLDKEVLTPTPHLKIFRNIFDNTFTDN